MLRRQPGGQRTGLAEDPRIADRAAGGRYAINARFDEHPQAVLGSEQVAAAQHDPLAGVPLHLAQEFPIARAIVALADGAAVDGDRRHAQRKRAVEDSIEVVAALRAVVQAAAHLYRERNVRRQGVTDAAHDLQRGRRSAQKKPAPAAAQDLLHRTAEVQVDDIEARLGQLQRGGRKVGRLRAMSCAPTGCSSFVVRMYRRALLPWLTWTMKRSSSTSPNV